MILLFANNAVTTLAAPISASATSVQVATGTGALFPNPIVGSQFFKMTFVDAATGLVNEIVHVTERVNDVMTIVRGQEGTNAVGWLAGDSAKNMTTAGTQSNFIQLQQAQADATNFAIDTGTPNNYAVALSPAVTTRIEGLRINIKAANSNTGASTLNVGAGSAPIINPDGSSLGSGAIIGGGIFEVVDDGVSYQLISSSQQAQSLAGAATTGAFQWRPTNETITGWVVANATTIGNAASNATQRANADTSNLFAWHWNNFSNTQCPVFTSAGVPTTRGANASVDFAANLQIQVFDKRGKGSIGVDTMGGAATTRLSGVPVTSGSATAPGSVLGENLHTLLVAELAQHNHGVNDPTHNHSTNASEITGQALTTVQSTFYAPDSWGGATINAAATGITIQNSGSNTPHNTVSLSDAGYWWIKL